MLTCPRDQLARRMLFAAAAIVALGLSAQDKLDLVEFMRTLTGEQIAAGLLADTSK